MDSTVGRLEAGYNERRLQVRATSANASGSVVLNEVVWGYNDFNQPVTEWQEHGGHVNAGSPKVQYTYADGSANTIRPTGITYPDGTTTIATDYNSTQASALSRPDRISGSGGVIASWQYLGLGAVVGRKFDAASGVESTLGTAAAGYPGIDRFGRLVETRWQNGTTDLVHTQYGRNRAGGVIWQRNTLAHGLTPAVATEDSYYWYDGLRQVTRHDRGDLTGSPYSGVVAATRQQKETFTFDQTGNWNNTTSESPWLDQGRTHNVANEITAIGSPYGVVQPPVRRGGQHDASCPGPAPGTPASPAPGTRGTGRSGCAPAPVRPARPIRVHRTPPRPNPVRLSPHPRNPVHRSPHPRNPVRPIHHRAPRNRVRRNRRRVPVPPAWTRPINTTR